MDEIEINRLPFAKEKFTAPEWYVQMINELKEQWRSGLDPVQNNRSSTETPPV